MKGAAAAFSARATPLLSPTRYSTRLGRIWRRWLSPGIIGACEAAAELGYSARGGGGGGTRPRFSAHAGLRRHPMARGARGRRRWLWDAHSLSEPFVVLRGRIDAVQFLRFSPNGWLLDTAKAADSVHVYDPVARLQEKELRRDDMTVALPTDVVQVSIRGCKE